MTIQEIAHSVQHEWIEDKKHGVCLRPMLFNNEGIRQVRLAPDAGEFMPPVQAVFKLAEMVKAQREKDNATQ